MTLVKCCFTVLNVCLVYGLPGHILQSSYIRHQVKVIRREMYDAYQTELYTTFFILHCYTHTVR